MYHVILSVMTATGAAVKYYILCYIFLITVCSCCYAMAYIHILPSTLFQRAIFTLPSITAVYWNLIH